jgi:hypothetical protein
MTGSAVPTLFSKVQQAVDPYARQVDVRSATLGIPDSMAYRIPGMSQELPMKTTPLGKPKERWGTFSTGTPGELAMSAAQSLLSATPVSKERAGIEVEKEFDRLSSYPGMPPAMPKRTKNIVLRGVHGEKVKLTDEEYSIYDKYNAMANQQLKQIVASPNYLSMPDPYKAKFLKKVYDKFRRAANQEINASIRLRTTVGD